MISFVSSVGNEDKTIILMVLTDFTVLQRDKLIWLLDECYSVFEMGKKSFEWRVQVSFLSLLDRKKSYKEYNIGIKFWSYNLVWHEWSSNLNASYLRECGSYIIVHAAISETNNYQLKQCIDCTFY